MHSPEEHQEEHQEAVEQEAVEQEALAGIPACLVQRTPVQAVVAVKIPMQVEAADQAS